MKKFIFPIFILIIGCFQPLLQAQSSAVNNGNSDYVVNPDHSVQGQILVQLTQETTIESVLAHWQKSFFKLENAREYFTFNEISNSLRIFRIDFSENFTKKEDVLYAAFHTAGIVTAQFNYEVQEREKQPTDPQFFKQQDMDLIRASLAWDGATGGVTPQGDTIVVAILEKGCFRNHPDLRENMWKNNQEIPNNNIDDDQNTFVDDYEGWDVRNSNDSEGTVGAHGVSVTGIIGARANNGVGVSGINWNVKLMSLTNVIKTDEIVLAYSYIAKQRRLYNMTGGKKGAFVVATNASFGLEKQFPASQPLWCAMYDELGKEGILSVGATDNVNVNVDVVGDLPSTCPSEYLIIVTNVGNNDVKVNGAAFGPIHVDMGAPGEAVWTTDFRINGTDTLFYGNFPGTSAATPHVTGTVGWMYSLPCSNLAADSKTDPTSCAKRMRDLILNNLSPNSSLKNITAKEGRLDMFNILEASRDLCGGSVGELGILEINSTISNGGKLEVVYQTPDFIPYTLRIIDVMGRVLFEKQIKPDQFSAKIVEIETENLMHGVYFLSIQSRNGITAKRFLRTGKL